MAAPITYLHIDHYRGEVEQLARFERVRLAESQLRTSFLTLLNAYARPRDRRLIEERTLDNTQKRPDGTLLVPLGVAVGYWESKGPGVDLEAEIQSARYSVSGR